MADIRISIITVVYNNKKTIEKCLTSIYNQNFPIELIVIDGGSKDGTLDIIKKYMNNIQYFSTTKDKGVYDALNKGIMNSTGDIVGILHSDDVYYNNCIISEIVDIFNQNPDVDIVCGNIVFKNSNENIIRIYNNKFFNIFTMRFGFMPAHTGTFIRKRVYDKYGLYDETLKSAGDFEFLLRILYVNRLKYIVIDKTVSIMGIGGLSTSGFSSYIRTTKEIYFSLNKYNIYTNYIFLILRLPIKYIYNFICMKFYFK